MKLTREEALKYHRQMWTDMQKDIGDTDNAELRTDYKTEWCEKHFPNEEISAYCFLCDYDEQKHANCWNCPIDWPHDEDGFPDCCCKDAYGYPYYLTTPISVILALPEREVEDGIDT